MTEILISIRPKWVEKILDGEKTVEIRKSAPKPPFKAYIYCTYGTVIFYDYIWRDGVLIRELRLGLYNVGQKSKPSNALNGKVVAEFVCNEVYMRPANVIYTPKGQTDYEELLKEACLTEAEALSYCGGQYNRDLFFWPITDLKIYKEPLELKKFSGQCSKIAECYADVVRHCDDAHFDWKCNPLTRPPQSWQYTRKP